MTLKLFLFTLLFLTFLLGLCNGATISDCIASERIALLDFKKNLIDEQDMLASWTHEDCCKWEGVSCNNVTGHVVTLDLRNPHPSFDELDGFRYNEWSLRGQLSPSLLGLKQLNYLDLSMNNFDGPIPMSVGSLHNLRYLNLSLAGFSGLIPPHLGNLTRLIYLDLTNIWSGFGYKEFTVSHDARWVSGFTSLKHLTMTNTKFDNFQNWMEALNVLPSIAEIRLSSCTISSFPVTLPNVNFTNLSYLDLSENSIQSESIPLWLFNIKSLTHIDLRVNLFRSIPQALENLTSLEYIDFSQNDFSGNLPQALKSLKECVKNLDLSWGGFDGSIPDWFGELHKLEELDLSRNYLNGTVPKSIGKLSNLGRLNLNYNYLEGVISEVHFASLTELKELRLASNNLILNVSGDWIPPFKLNVIDIDSCKIGPKFPAWLQTQANISKLRMSNNGIVDTLPNWFWDVFASYSYDGCIYLDISSNGIVGSLPTLSKLCFSYFGLGDNFFEGPLPPSLNISYTLDISNNSFSGSIQSILYNQVLSSIDLSRNNFSGEIPSAICLTDVQFINLSWNFFTGELPNCWNLLTSPIFIDFSTNKLTGNIPHTFSTLPHLELLHMGNNNLNGSIPSTLRNCTNLLTLDLGMNKLEGRIPTWIGENLTSLSVLVLRSNNFIGNVPSNLWKRTFLQVLDLGNNKLSGRIPRSIGNLTGMIDLQYIPGDYWFSGTTELTIKGRDRAYVKLLFQMTNIDFSCNNLSGHIPKELGNLRQLIYLNLSGNHLVGSIPNEIGLMYSLESLDLSSNELSGNIPISMSNMTMLSSLSLAYNNLSGMIPSGNQLQTLSNESYIGNPELCGFPLTKSCDSDKTVNDEAPEDETSLLDNWYVSIAPGFVFGFWIVWCTLLLKKKWKNAYFRYVDSVYDAVYVAIVVKIRNARKGDETTSG